MGLSTALIPGQTRGCRNRTLRHPLALGHRVPRAHRILLVITATEVLFLTVALSLISPSP